MITSWRFIGMCIGIGDHLGKDEFVPLCGTSNLPSSLVLNPDSAWTCWFRLVPSTTGRLIEGKRRPQGGVTVEASYTFQDDHGRRVRQFWAAVENVHLEIGTTANTISLHGEKVLQLDVG